MARTAPPNPCRPRCPLHAAAELKMTWHPQGDYLAVQVDKWTKTKKSTHTNFELFSIRWVGGRRRWGSRVAWGGGGGGGPPRPLACSKADASVCVR